MHFVLLFRPVQWHWSRLSESVINFVAVTLQNPISYCALSIFGRVTRTNTRRRNKLEDTRTPLAIRSTILIFVACCRGQLTFARVIIPISLKLRDCVPKFRKFPGVGLPCYALLIQRESMSFIIKFLNATLRRRQNILFLFFHVH